MPKVSVIMPVYNGEEFLEEAVQSIRNQSMQDIEIILVNDLSTDRSGEICDRLASEDERVSVIHLPNNKGICGARNEGLKIAKGEYIAFCDNDDFFENNLVEDNYYLANKYSADMIKFGRKLIDVDSEGKVLREKSTPLEKGSYFDEQTKLDNYFYMKSKGLLMNVWNGMYKRQLILDRGIWFNEFMRFGSEDADFSYRFFQKCKTIVVNPGVYYVHYRRNEFSTSRKFNRNKLDSMIMASKEEGIIIGEMDQSLEIQAKKIIEINKLIMNMYTQQVFHDDNPMSLKEKVDFLNEIKDNNHLSYDIDTELMKEIGKIKKKHIPFSIAFSRNWMSMAFIILVLQKRMNNETW